MKTLAKSNTFFPEIKSSFGDFFTNPFLDSDWLKDSRMPAVNVKETEKSYVLEVAAPGLKKDDFKLEVEDGYLTISSNTENEKIEEKENYSRKEYSYSSFYRSFALPKDVEEKNISASYKNGILEVVLTRTKNGFKNHSKTIKVN